MIKIGDFGMSRYAAPVRGAGGSKASLARTLTPGVIGEEQEQEPESGAPVWVLDCICCVMFSFWS